MSEAQVIETTASEVPVATPVPTDALQSFTRLGIGIRDATRLANDLRAIVDSRRLATVIGGREHLRIEAWTSLGSMVGVSAATEWCREIRHPATGELDGYHARVRVIRLATGEEVGAAENVCCFDETVERRDGSSYSRWVDREGTPVRHAAMSMSQTRAAAKALGQVLRWIPVLAGYEGTAAEEMPERPAERDEKRERRARAPREREGGRAPSRGPAAAAPREGAGPSATAPRFLFLPGDPPPPRPSYGLWTDDAPTSNTESPYAAKTWGYMAEGGYKGGEGGRYSWLRYVVEHSPSKSQVERARYCIYLIEQREHERAAEPAKTAEAEKF